VAIPSRKNLPKEEAKACYTVLDEQRFDFWGNRIEKKD